MGEYLGAYFTPNGSYLMQDAADGLRTTQLDTFAQVEAEIEAADPDALVVVTPHWLPRRSFYVENGLHHYQTNDYPLLPQAWGRRYFEYDVAGDPHLADAIVAAGADFGVPVEPKDYGIDHGAFTSLKVMRNSRPVVVASTGLRSYEESIKWGRAIRAGIENSGRRVSVLCPGNLSHRLDLREDVDEDGYDAQMKEFDETALNLVKLGNYGYPLQDIPRELFEAASPETGLRTFPILWGITGGSAGEVMAYVGFKKSVGDAFVRFPASAPIKQNDKAMQSEGGR